MDLDAEIVQSLGGGVVRWPVGDDGGGRVVGASVDLLRPPVRHPLRGRRVRIRGVDPIAIFGLIRRVFRFFLFRAVTSHFLTVSSSPEVNDGFGGPPCRPFSFFLCAFRFFL